GGTTSDPKAPPTAAEIFAAMGRLVNAAHGRGLKIYIATLTPFDGVEYEGYYSEKKEMIRQEVNQWIRSSKSIDGYIDFDRAVADPARPTMLNPKFDLDHQH